MTYTEILAPHLDDAVLSAWHQIILPNTRVLTLFAGIPTQAKPSLWDRLTTGKDAQTTMQNRLAENAQALKGSGAEIVNFDYLDRLYHKGPRNIQGIADSVEATLRPQTRILAAAGLGSYLRAHPDHKTTRLVALELHRRGHDVNFYADIPYMLPLAQLENWPNKLSSTSLSRRLGVQVKIIQINLQPADQAAKRTAFNAYKSQVAGVNLIAAGAMSKNGAYYYEALLQIKQNNI